MTSPRSLSAPRVSYRNSQRRKNCSLPNKDVPLEERKRSEPKVDRSGEKKKDKHREALGRVELSSRKAKA